MRSDRQASMPLSILESSEARDAMTRLKSHPDDLELNRIVWSYYTERGDYDTVVLYAEPVFRRTAGRPDKQKLWLYAGAFSSQACVFQNKFDSAAYFLNRIMPFVEERDSGEDFLSALVHNTAALYSLKTELDYSAALEHYEAVCSSLERSGDMLNLSTCLCNIASIYWILRDSSGFKYAERAWELNHEGGGGVRAYTMALSSILLGQMYYLKGEYSMAEACVREVRPEIMAFPELIPNLYLLYADIAVEDDNPGVAEYYYRKAMKYGTEAEPSDRLLTILRYSGFLSGHGRYSEARKLLLDGLALSRRLNVMVYRSDLLTSLAQVSASLGKDREALEWWQQYGADIDSMLYQQKERSFRQNQLFAKDLQIKEYELSLMTTRRRQVVIVSMIVVAFVVISALILVNCRQRRMYRRLVSLHQKMLKSAALPDGVEDRDRQLWLKLDSLMHNERIYRKRDISLDRMAEILGTNRTYVSRIINKYAGATFYNYIHSARIEEASRELSDPSSRKPLKALASDLGYNSLSSFYRAFVKETGVPPSRYREEALKMKS